MTKPSFNPPEAAKAQKTVDEFAPKNRQSTEPAPEPAPPKVFDTTTPAVGGLIVRRFSLGDLPRYADKIYPLLKGIFPHLNERMYGGWLRGCVNDNSCMFICADSADKSDGAICMAYAFHRPMNPVPVVEILFCLGFAEKFQLMYEHILKWAAELGAKEVHINSPQDESLLRKLKGQTSPIENRVTHILHVS